MKVPAVFDAYWSPWMARRTPLPAETIRHRMTAYIYGNVLVLAAVMSLGQHEVTGWSVVTVLGVAVSTFLAHLFAGAVTATDWSWRTLRSQARDSAPILTSGLVPVLLLLTALVGAPATLAVIVASLLLIVRLGFVGVLVAGLRRETPSTGNVVAGVTFALVALVIVLIKVTLTH